MFVFNIPVNSLRPKPLCVTDSACFQDEFSSTIHYKLVISTKVYSSEYVARWNMGGFEDSIRTFNKLLLEQRFLDDYPRWWDGRGFAYEEVILTKPFTLEGLVIDSTKVSLSIERTFSPGVWYFP